MKSHEGIFHIVGFLVHGGVPSLTYYGDVMRLYIYCSIFVQVYWLIARRHQITTWATDELFVKWAFIEQNQMLIPENAF